jgi:hypothetical protein
VKFVTWLGWTVNMEKSVMTPSKEWKYLGMIWKTGPGEDDMTVQMVKEKNTAVKKELKGWIPKVKSGTVVKVRELARLIGRLSAMRAQHEEASLYLAKMNRLKCEAVRASGWEAKVRLQPMVLPELHWWLRATSANVPNSIRPFVPTVTCYTDASETGWGGSCCTAEDGETWIHGWWNKREVYVNCMRELMAVVHVIINGVQRGWIMEGTDVLARKDNTNVVYNLNRKRSGWRM